MLHFYRAGFASGTMYVKVTVSGTIHSFTITAAQNNSNINFGTEEIRDAVLGKYPSFFTLPA
jgi:hypothetical protein